MAAHYSVGRKVSHIALPNGIYPESNSSCRLVSSKHVITLYGAHLTHAVLNNRRMDYDRTRISAGDIIKGYILDSSEPSHGVVSCDGQHPKFSVC